MTYGENGEVTLDTAFSLSFLQKMVERQLLTKEFLKAMASGDSSARSDTDFMNIPYCCYLNATQDPMTKAEFEDRFVLNFPFMHKLYMYVIVGDVADSTMKNIFRVKQDPK